MGNTLDEVMIQSVMKPGVYASKIYSGECTVEDAQGTEPGTGELNELLPTTRPIISLGVG